MKGASGLLIAVALGVIGAFCNWIYLAQKGRELDLVDFIGIDENVKISAGDKFSEGHLTKISIPGSSVGGLDKAAVRWDDRSTVIGQVATKSYSPGEILLRQQLKTPAEMDIKKLLARDERAVWIPVDTRTFVPALVNGGDQVSFIVPKLTLGGLTPVAEPSQPVSDGEQPGVGGGRAPASTDTIGPFRILALGTRMGSREVTTPYGMTAGQENVMAVAIKFVNGEFEEKGQKLLDLQRLNNFQQVQVVLHPSSEEVKPGR